MSACLICGGNFRAEQATDLEAQTNVIFLLQNILGVPSTKCVEYLARFGSPSEWINICPQKCLPTISSGLDAYKQIVALRAKLGVIKGQLLDGIRHSKSKSKNRGKGKANSSFGSISMSIEEELREFAAMDSKINQFSEFVETLPNFAAADIKVEAQEEGSLLSFEAFEGWEIDPEPEKEFRIKTAATPHDISAAMETTSNGKFICSLCPKIFGLRKSLRNHQNLAHNLYFKKGRPKEAQHELRAEEKVANLLNWKEIVADPTNETSFTCALCAKAFKTKYKIKRHVQAVHLDKVEKAKNAKARAAATSEQAARESNECLECIQSFSSKLAARNHNLIFHSELEDSGLRTRRLDYLQLVKEVELTPWKCCECFRWFSNEVLREQHQRAEHDKPLSHLPEQDLQFPCDRCEFRRYATAGELSLHKENAHGGSGLEENEARFACTACPSRFVDASKLEFHFGHVHGILANPKKAKVSGICPICGLASINLNILYTHMKLHRAGNSKLRFFCELCNSAFATNAFLEAHKAEEHGNSDSSDS